MPPIEEWCCATAQARGAVAASVCAAMPVRLQRRGREQARGRIEVNVGPCGGMARRGDSGVAMASERARRQGWRADRRGSARRAGNRRGEAMIALGMAIPGIRGF